MEVHNKVLVNILKILRMQHRAEQNGVDKKKVHSFCIFLLRIVVEKILEMLFLFLFDEKKIIYVTPVRVWRVFKRIFKKDESARLI